MKGNGRSFFPTDQRPTRILYALLLPAAALAFGRLAGPCGALALRGVKAVAEAGTHGFVRSGLIALLLLCLLALLGWQIRDTVKTFRRKAWVVYAAAFAFSPFALLFSRDAEAWLAELVFLLFAARAALQPALLRQESRYRGAAVGSLIFLLLLGGLTALDPAGRVPGAGDIALYLALLAAFAAELILCARKQRDIRLLSSAMDDSAMAGELKLALGGEGVRQLLPYFRQQLREGSSVAKLLILDLMRGIDFDGKEALAKIAFDAGPLEVRLALVDQIFDWHLPYGFLGYAAERCDAQLAEYLVRSVFLHGADVADHGALADFQRRLDLKLREMLTRETKRMFDYIGGARGEYANILGALLRSDRKEDRLLAAQIMSAYIGREDEVNRERLADVIGKTAWNPSEIEEMIELCAEYDAGMGYLKRDLSNYYGYAYLQKICEYYEPLSIARTFGASACPVPTALTLLAACRLSREDAGAYRAKADQLADYLVRLTREENGIRLAGFAAGKLLLDEIAGLKRTLCAAALGYLQWIWNGNRSPDMAADILRALAEGEPERLTAGLPGEIAARLVQALSGEIPTGGGVDYGALRVSENNALLEQIYAYSGGEIMEQRVTENIEKLITLKGIPMFRELDIFTLQQIQKIAAYKRIAAGETVITEGEEGDSLYVVIHGRVGVYKGGERINEIGPGGLVGEMAVIEKQRRSATIRTLEETEFLIIEGGDFEKLLERNSSISNAVIRTLSGRLRKMLEERQ